jgi:plastocyanin
MKPPPTSTFFSALVLIGLVAIAQADTASSIDWSKAQTVELRMIEYQFIPDQLTLRHGQPYRLHVVNAGKEGHDFTAPEFFQSAIVQDTGAFNDSRSSVFLQPQQMIDIYLIAQNAGLFAPRCADHDWAGMTATIVVE